MFHMSGQFVHSFAEWGSGRGELKYPRGIAIDQDGLYLIVILAIIIYKCFKYHESLIMLLVFGLGSHVCLCVGS